MSIIILPTSLPSLICSGYDQTDLKFIQKILFSENFFFFFFIYIYIIIIIILEVTLRIDTRVYNYFDILSPAYIWTSVLLSAYSEQAFFHITHTSLGGCRCFPIEGYGLTLLPISLC